MHLNILIADGDNRLCHLYSNFLEREGYSVEVASGGVDCLAKLRQSRPAGLVLALELPWGGAAGVFACLRGERLPAPGVVLTTGGASEESLRDLLAPPVAYALQKPFPVSALRRAVQAALTKPAPACARVECFVDGAAAETRFTPRPGGENQASAAGTGVLVVDDEAYMRSFLQVALEHQGFDVCLAASGWEAVELYRRHRDRITVALLDVRMPGLNGPETVEALREINPQLRYAFMTGNAGNDQTGQWLEQSGAPVLAKPFRLEKVTRVLRRLAGGKNAALAQVSEPVEAC